jgi:hypothetical protein
MLDKKDLYQQNIINALSSSVQELQQDIDMHCCLVASLIDGQADKGHFRQCLECCPVRSREIQLREAIKEAIEVLEESKKAFKSKKLEILRKKLTHVLIDT